MCGWHLVATGGVVCPLVNWLGRGNRWYGLWELATIGIRFLGLISERGIPVLNKLYDVGKHPVVSRKGPTPTHVWYQVRCRGPEHPVITKPLTVAVEFDTKHGMSSNRLTNKGLALLTISKLDTHTTSCSDPLELCQKAGTVRSRKR